MVRQDRARKVHERVRPPTPLDLQRLGITREEWDGLASLARQRHRERGRLSPGSLIAGECVCGTKCYQPTPDSCAVLGRLVDLALLAESDTR